MRLPAIRGMIDRRILANYRVDPKHMAAALPAPFRPQLVNGFAIGGICLIRLKQVRPKFLPIPWGIGSENAAHRIAVEWETDGQLNHGVYIPRRDTNSRLNTWAGGKVFPGVHHLATFDVVESDEHYSVSMTSEDGEADVRVVGTIAADIPKTSVFDSIEAASRFFEQGSLGYSGKGQSGRFDGLELQCQSWHVEAMNVTEVHSSFFDDRSKFPVGAAEVDCVLLMRDIDHEWHERPELCCETAT